MLGSTIGIHGGAREGLPKDWTAGCIGMYDEDVEEIFEYIDKGTSVVIAD
jgi:lipoprotein-anchoring transpeptidase ErfK/SrfK